VHLPPRAASTGVAGPASTEGRLFFAGADSAIAWRSFIDGAIQSGYRAARDIDDYLTPVGDQA
jgi:monoamine oxidase